MPSTYSNLKFQLMATGENSTTWGDVTNVNLGTAIEEAIAGSADVTFASGNVTLTLTDTNATQSARNMRLRCTGVTGGSTRNLIVPSIEKAYIVKNDCADSILVKTAAGSGITVPAGKTMWVYNDGTNVVDAVTRLTSLTLGTALAVADGGTGQTAFSSGYVVKGNGSSALSTGIIYDTGSEVGISTASPETTFDVNGSQIIRGDTNGFALFVPKYGTGAFGVNYDRFEIKVDSATQVTTIGNTNGGTGVARALAFLSGGSERMRIDTSGNVGIGTSTPTVKLRVDYSDTNYVGGLLVANTANSGNAWGRIDVANTNTGGSLVLAQELSGQCNIINTTNNPLALSTNNTTRMTIAANGNVGIGTLSPSDKLDVSGAIRSSGTILSSDLATGLGVTTGDCAFEHGRERTGNGNTYIDFHSTSGSDYEARIARYTGVNGGLDIVNTGTGNMLIGQIGAGALLFNTNSSTRMTVDSSGNVGVGAPSAARRFEVTSSAYASAQFNSDISAAPGSLDAGEVFNFSGNAAVSGVTFSGSDPRLLAFGVSPSNFVYARASSLDLIGTNTISISTGATERLRFNSSGALGLSGANYGSSGQVLTSQGSGSPPIWSSAASGTVTSVGGTGSVNGLTLTGTVTSSGNLTLGGSVSSVATGATIDGVTIGYRSIPRSTTSGTATTADVGKCIAVSAGITIPNSTFAAGDAISIYNDSGSSITITAGVTTLRQAGTANTGNRTLAARGMATIWFNSATEAIISGAGVS